MTQRNAPDLDLVLGAFLGEGPREAPDRAIDGALDTIATTGQIRRPFTGGRFTMPRQFRLVAIAAAVVVLVALAALYAGNRQPTPSSVPSVVPTLATGSAPSPTIEPSPSQAAAVDPVLPLVRAAVTALDDAVVASVGADGLNASDEGKLLQLTDDMAVTIDEQHVRPAHDVYDRFVSRFESLAASMSVAKADAIRSAMAGLKAILESTPFAAGMTAGTHYSEAFKPSVVIDLPNGWTPGQQDQEGLLIKRGAISLAFHFQGPTTVSAAAIGDAVHPGTGITFGEFTGFESTFPVEATPGVTLYIDSGLRAVDAQAGEATHAWLVDFRGKPLTIVLVGLPADVTAALPEVRAILATLQSP